MRIGGQAVMEGVMMRGYTSMSTTVIDQEGNYRSEKKYIEDRREKKYSKIPIIRGVVNFFVSLIQGVKTLTSSSAIYLEEEEKDNKKDKKGKKNEKAKESVELGITVAIALAFSLLLFFIVPNLLISLIDRVFGVSHTYLKNILEGLSRFLIFFIYLISVSQVKDIKRTFMFHGAEHKTINCYEKGLELTIPNIKKQSTINDRCGTTFLFLVMLLSLLIYAFMPWFSNVFIRILTRLALLPIVAGVSYEILMLLSKSDSKFVTALKKPGLALQYITTKEPDDDRILVCALTSFKNVLEMEQDKNIKEEFFRTPIKLSSLYKEQANILKDYEDKAALDWIICDVLNIRRSEIKGYKENVSITKQYKIADYVQRLLKNEPVQLILGHTDFYGLDIKVSRECLIPRPETEILVEQAIKLLKDKDNVLDICCGTGAIGLAIKANRNVNVSLSDISSSALKIARENAKKHNLKVKFINSDMFSDVNNQYDMICSNPPYIKTSELDKLDPIVKFNDPKLALDGGRDGLKFYRVLAREAKEFLNEGGYLLLEVGDAEGVLKILDKDYTTKIVNDYNGLKRVIIAKLKD